MIALLLQVASGSCTGPAPFTEVFEHRVPREQPVHVFTWRDAATTASDLRLRDADGKRVDVRAETLGEQTLRLLPPAGGWPTATLHIEERAGFESDGTRPRPEVVEPHHTAWFRLATVAVTAEPLGDLTLPEVTWARESTLQASRIEATLQAPSEPTHVLALELDGIGPIGWQRRNVHMPPSWPVRSTANVACNDTEQMQPLPSTGNVRARLVLHGRHGERTASPWVVLGPDGPLKSRRWRRRQAADLSRMDRWTPVVVDVADDTPVVSSIGDCSRLVVDEARTRVGGGEDAPPLDGGLVGGFEFTEDDDTEEPSLFFDGHEVYRDYGLHVSNALGRSPPWEHPRGAVVVDGERLRVTSMDPETGERTDTWLVCDAELIGVPLRYLPTGTP